MLLKELLEKLRPVLEAISDAVCVFDTGGNYVFENQPYRNMISRAKSEMVADSRDITAGGELLGRVVVYHDNSELNRLRRELERVRQGLRRAEARYGFEDIVGEGAGLARLKQLAKSAALTPAALLLEGEAGAGKETLANAIHNTSRRKTQSFATVNCADYDAEQLEYRLFGYLHGAFAASRRGGERGLILDANRGTVFIDNIDLLPPPLQTKLLRVLAEREVVPAGGQTGVKVDVRFISATRQDISAMAETGAFSRELLGRLAVFHFKLPPLRERPQDVEAVTQYFINQYNLMFGRRVRRASPEAIELLAAQRWPGNLRELEGVISRTLFGMGESEDTLQKMHLIDMLERTAREDAARANGKGEDSDAMPPGNTVVVRLADAVGETERSYIQRALARHKGDRQKAANDLDIPLRTLYYKCKKFGIT